MLTDQHNIHQGSYNEGDFQEVSLYHRRALHFFFNLHYFYMTFIDTGAPVIFSATYVGPNFEGKNSWHF